MFRSRIYTGLALGQAVEGSGNNINRYRTIIEYKLEDERMNITGSEWRIRPEGGNKYEQ